MDERHQILELERTPGEMSFEARIGGDSRQIWLRGGNQVPSADAALAAALMPAMRDGGVLEIGDPISPRLLRTQREFQAVQMAWSLDWPYGSMPLREVEVRAPARSAPARRPSGRVAAFFSGGVDSWATVLDNPDVTDLVFVRGFDLLPEAAHQAALADEVEARLRAAAKAVGRPLHVVETNLRQLSDPLLPWEAYFGCADVAAAHFLAPSFDRVLISTDSDYEVQERFGIAWMVSQAWSTEELEIVETCGRFSRAQRLERIVSNPVVRSSLRVCWENRGGAYNCGRCSKCPLALCELEALACASRSRPSRTGWTSTPCRRSRSRCRSCSPSGKMRSTRRGMRVSHGSSAHWRMW